MGKWLYCTCTQVSMVYVGKWLHCNLYTSQYGVRGEMVTLQPVHKSVWCTGEGKWLHCSLYTSQYDVQLWGQTTLHLYASQYGVQVRENGYTAPVHKSVWCTWGNGYTHLLTLKAHDFSWWMLLVPHWSFVRTLK